MLSRVLPPAVLCAVALAACGGAGADDDRGRRPASTSDSVPRERNEPAPLDLPPDVPQQASGVADPAEAKVIRAWAGALREGDIAGASALWAAPSTVQNGTPVLKLRGLSDVRAFNRALPCGAVLTASAGAPRGFTIITVRLIQRRGADCGSGVDASARAAIRVRDGKIVEWYRLPNDPDAPAPDGVDATTV